MTYSKRPIKVRELYQQIYILQRRMSSYKTKINQWKIQIIELRKEIDKEMFFNKLRQGKRRK